MRYHGVYHRIITQYRAGCGGHGLVYRPAFKDDHTSDPDKETGDGENGRERRHAELPRGDRLCACDGDRTGVRSGQLCVCDRDHSGDHCHARRARSEMGDGRAGAYPE